jgi:hypothetical protein
MANAYGFMMAQKGLRGEHRGAARGSQFATAVLAFGSWSLGITWLIVLVHNNK